MVEKLKEKNEAPTPAVLFSQLENYAYARDVDFRSGKTLASEDLWRQKTDPVYPLEVYMDYDPADDEEDDQPPQYDMRTISFEATRSLQDKSSPPRRITIGFELLTQLIALPPGLMPHLSEDNIELYSYAGPGDLHALQSVEYSLERDGDDVEITRNLAYILRNYREEVIYATSEIDELGQDELITIPYEKEAVRISPIITTERVPDQDNQIIYNEEFSDLFDGSHISFYNELLEARTNEAILCIVSLFRSIKDRTTIPNIITRIPKDIDDI